MTDKIQADGESSASGSSQAASEYSTVADLWIKRDKSAADFVDLTKNGVVAVSLEVEDFRDGERATIFLKQDDIERLKWWCEQVLKGVRYEEL